MDRTGDKLGLCLSGGGFRAALFHIGTLAALAESGLLHKVEVLSTVSGGSIIGAYYYLKVKQLLEGKRPGCPAPDPLVYIDIVQEVERDFLTGVQQNLRARLFSNPYKTARMLLEEEYSRSDRMAELLDKYFYNSIALIDGIRLKDIHIIPVAKNSYLKAEGEFSAKKYNENEEYKIPVLIINSTCLNTGHPWEFTGSWMGEPQREGMYKREQNNNCLLQQLRFDGRYENDRSRTVESWQLATMNTIRLSDAVASSAAVPAIFPPFPIHNLFRDSGGDEIVVELSDGGVFDNQGLVALLSAHSTHIFVSDACGQFVDKNLLSTSPFKVVQRANDVMMERIRGYGYLDLGLRTEIHNKLSSTDPLRREIFFVKESKYTHLREVAPNTAALPGLPGPGCQQGGVVYHLSGVRTDLDAFSDMEAYTLMYQAYALAKDKLSCFDMKGTTSVAQAKQWRFLEIADVIRDDLSRLAKHLSVSRMKLFKTYFLAPFRSWIWFVLLLSPLLVVVGSWLYYNWETPIVLPVPQLTVRELLWQASIAVIMLLPMSGKGRYLFKTIPWLRALKQNHASKILASILSMGVTVLAMLAWIVVFIQLNIYNPIFLKVGKLK